MQGGIAFLPVTAIVTGSDSGIGRATAVELARSGLHIGITWHTDQQGGRKTAAGGSLASDSRPWCGSWTRPTSGARQQSSIRSPRSSGDWTSSSITPARATGPSSSTWISKRGRGRLDTNLNGAFVCMQSAARRMVKAGTGRPHHCRHQCPRNAAAGRRLRVRCLKARTGRADQDHRPGTRGVWHHGEQRGTGRDRHTHDRTNRSGPHHDGSAGHSPWKARGRPGSCRRHRLPGLSGFKLRHRSLLGSGRGMLQMGPQAGSHITGYSWRNT